MIDGKPVRDQPTSLPGGNPFNDVAAEAATSVASKQINSFMADLRS